MTQSEQLINLMESHKPISKKTANAILAHIKRMRSV